MTQNTLLLSAIMLLFAQATFCQNSKKASISSISVQTGFVNEQEADWQLADFRRLIPQSALLQKDYSLFKQNGGTSLQTSPMVSANLGITFGESKKGHPELRIGLIYFSQYASTYLYAEERKPYDTLISTQTGEMYLLDSLKTSYLRGNYTCDQLRADIAWVYRTNPEARFSAYGGIGGTMGGSINAFSTISYNENRAKATLLSGSSYYFNSNSRDYQSEHFTLKNNMGFSAYIPAGLDFRIFKKHLFWSRFHLFYEGRAGVNVSFIPNMTPTKNISLLQGVGLKVRI